MVDFKQVRGGLRWRPDIGGAVAVQLHAVARR